MPNMADITVKKADGSTNVTYVKQQPSAGDNQPAIWKEVTTGEVRSGQPTLSARARSNGNLGARRLDGSYLYPKVRDDAGGNPVVKGGLSMSLSILVPQDMTDAEISEGVNQGLNLFSATLFKESATTGYAPS